MNIHKDIKKATAVGDYEWRAGAVGGGQMAAPIFGMIQAQIMGVLISGGSLHGDRNC